MPKPRKTVTTKARTVRIPEELDRKIEIVLMDPATGRARFGAWSDLATELFTRWLNERIREMQSENDPNHFSP